MKCNICGAEMDEGNSFCLACGAKLDETPVEPVVSQPAPEEPAPAFQPISAPENNEDAAAPPPPPMGAAVSPPRFFDDNLAPIISMGHWLITLLILFIVPVAVAILAGIISGLADNDIISTILSVLAALSGVGLMLFWAFNKRTNPSKRNFFRAYLIFFVIILVIVIVVVLVFSAYIARYISQMGLNDPQQLLQMFMNM